MALKDVVSVYRNITEKCMDSRSFSGKIILSDDNITSLKAISSPYRLEDSEQIEYQSGSEIEIKVRLGSGQGSAHYKDVQALLTSAPGIKEGKFPSEFYLFSEDIYYPEKSNNEINTLIQVYDVISNLIKLAHYHDEKASGSNLKLVFLSNNSNSHKPLILHVNTFPELLKAQFTDLSSINQLTSSKALNDIHHPANLSVFFSSLSEFIEIERSPKDSFKKLLTQWNDFSELFQQNLSTYSSGFAFHKAKKEVANAEINFSEQLSSITSNITTQLFSIPISLAVTTVLIPKTTNVWSDIIIELGLLLSALFIVGSVANQQNRFEIVVQSKDLVLGAIEGDKTQYPEDLKVSIATMKTIVANNIKKTRYWLWSFRSIAWIPVIAGAVVLKYKYNLNIL